MIKTKQKMDRNEEKHKEIFKKKEERMLRKCGGGQLLKAKTPRKIESKK